MILVSKKLAKRTKKKPKIIRRKTRKRAKISQKVRKRKRNRRLKKNKTRMMLNSRDCMEWAKILNPTKLQLTRARMIRTRK